MEGIFDVIEGIGCLKGSYQIEIDPMAKLVIHPPHQVPAVTLKDPLKKELKRMVKERVVALISDPTDWVSSMVTVKPKK